MKVLTNSYKIIQEYDILVDWIDSIEWIYKRSSLRLFSKFDLEVILLIRIESLPFNNEIVELIREKKEMVTYNASMKDR